MSISIDFADFIEDIDIYTTTYSRTDGKVSKTDVSSTIEAIIQPYSETSLNSNPSMRDKKLEGKDTKGNILILTDSDLKIDDTDTFLDYDDKRYRIDQRMPYNKVIGHYEYIACMVKS